MENFITTDFDEWRSEIIKQYKHDLPDKLIFPVEVKDFSTGYMQYPIGAVGDRVMTAVEYSSPSLSDSFQYFKNMALTQNVFMYQVLWRHAQVDNYIINTYIFRFSTLPKDSE